MVATVHNTLRDELLTALRSTPVAAAAGVADEAWASLTSKRVSPGLRGYIGSLHRGRLPYIELFTPAEQRENTSWHRSWIHTQWTLRVHVIGPDVTTADDLARLITYTALAEIRNNLRLKFGSEQTAQLDSTPLGFALDTVLEIENRSSRDTFDVLPGVLLLQTTGRLLLNSQTDAALILEGGRSPNTALPTPFSFRTTDDGSQRVTRDGSRRITR